MRRRHHDEQAPVSVTDVRFHHHGRASTMHGRGLGAHRAVIGVAQEIRAELDGQGELRGAAVESAAGPVHAGESGRGVRQGEQRPGVQYAGELLQLGGERHLSHSTLIGDLNDSETYKFYRRYPGYAPEPGQ